MPDPSAPSAQARPAEAASEVVSVTALTAATDPRRRSFVRAAAIAGGIVVLVAGVGVIYSRDPVRPPAVAEPAKPWPTPSKVTGPSDRAISTLTAQSAALVKGDQKAFLATVTPALRKQYTDLFTDLRALDVTTFDYQVRGDPSAKSMAVDIAYCFGQSMCSATVRPPHISQTLTLQPGPGGDYVISKVTGPQQVPWALGGLVFAQGKRVTLATTPGQAKYLAQYLPVAEAAAAVDDRFAKINGTPQQRYRVYLAGEPQWKAWYGGLGGKWGAGVAIPLNKSATDVVIRLKYMYDTATLRETLQHELGHVVTLTGANNNDITKQSWLVEGIAEYIGWWPRHAPASSNAGYLRWSLARRRPPESMVSSRPGGTATLKTVNAFYALSHFGADCMGHRFGETKLLAFVRLVLAGGDSYEKASLDAYGVPFAPLDRSCMSWIKQQV